MLSCFPAIGVLELGRGSCAALQPVVNTQTNPMFLQSHIHKPPSYNLFQGSCCRSMLLLPATELTSPDVPVLFWDLTPTYFPFLKQHAKERDASHKSMPRHLFALCLDKQLFTSYSLVCTPSDLAVCLEWTWYKRLILAMFNIFICISVLRGLTACREVERESKSRNRRVELRMRSGYSPECEGD